MKIKYIITILLFSGIGIQLPAQIKYTLEDCKNIAIENNKKIKNSLLEIKSAQESKKDVFTSYFPNISAMAFGFKAKDPMMTMDMGGTPVGLLDDGLTGAITLNQPIFVGGKIVYGNKLAKLGIEVKEQKARLSENEVLYNVENQYWELVSLYEKMNTVTIIDEQLATLHKDVETSYEAGLITLNDVLQVKLKQNELKSNRANLENGILLLKMSLCQEMGFDLETSDNFDIAISDIQEPNPPMTFYMSHREALSNRAESKLLDKNIEATKLQTKMKRADYLPTVSVGATYFQNNFMDKWDGNGAVFISVSVPISGWWGGSHAIRKQKIDEQIAYNNKMDGQEQLLLQMQNVRNEFDNAYKQLLIAKESIEQSTENLRLNNDYYRVGMVKLTDVLDAQALLQQSRDKYVDSHSTYQKKRFEYLQVTGR
ncbi:MAG: TolC family protein [Prevotella sp.]|jgi:outer membrane protein TolC|nr:TolC family protein [Prevotella sp.]